MLAANSPLPVRWSEDQQNFHPGTVHVAPRERHLLLRAGQTRVRFGARFTDNALLEAVMPSTGQMIWQVIRSLEESLMLLIHMGQPNQ